MNVLIGIEFQGTKCKDSTQRRTASLWRVFELFNVPNKIDYLSLDVEGAELFIMEAFPFDKYQFSVLTTEWVPDGFEETIDDEWLQISTSFPWLGNFVGSWINGSFAINSGA